jgi:hypothetical protein
MTSLPSRAFFRSGLESVSLLLPAINRALSVVLQAESKGIVVSSAIGCPCSGMRAMLFPADIFRHTVPAGIGSAVIGIVRSIVRVIGIVRPIGRVIRAIVPYSVARSVTAGAISTRAIPSRSIRAGAISPRSIPTGAITYTSYSSRTSTANAASSRTPSASRTINLWRFGIQLH